MAGRKTLSPGSRKNNARAKDLVFAEIIRARREELGITQTELAKRMSVSPGNVSGFEAGIFPSSRERIIALARALETTPDYLFGFRDEP